MAFAILGIGTSVPDTIITQTDALNIARSLCCRTKAHETWLPSMYEGTGIETRRLCLGADLVRDVLDGTRHSGSIFLPSGASDDRGPTTAQRMRHYAHAAPPLALAASQQALGRSGITAAEITHVVTVSCTGFLAPGVDMALIRGLGLAADVQRTHVGYMGCHGAINGMRVAEAVAASEPGARVLLCAVELCSIHYHYGWDPQKMIANAIFADGAAACVGWRAGDDSPPWMPRAAPRGRPRGTIVPRSPTDQWTAVASGSCLLPNSADAMTWTIGDHGFEMTLSRRVPALIAAHLRPWLETWLERHGLTLAEVASWAVHPGGPRILSAVEEALRLPAAATAASRAVFAEFGNMSSPTVLFILDRLQRDAAPRPCLALGFGPGLMAEVLLLR
jgi:predicted naringenin-chalcone synthase